MIVIDDNRKLATVEQISEIAPINGADNIVSARVRSWNVVVKKNEFEVGDVVVFFEVDTALPVADPRFEFLASRGVKSFENNEFHVLKTAKLRGVYSQGLVVSIDAFPEIESVSVGENVTAALGLGKWETPIIENAGNISGDFLTQYAQKTDSERVQNLAAMWDSITQFNWVATEKVDGSSLTFLMDENEDIRVCSRNKEIASGDNLYWNAARQSGLIDVLVPGKVIQAEIVGPKVQNNRLNLSANRIFVFDVIMDRVPVPRKDWDQQILDLAVPVIDINVSTPDELVAEVDGLKSVVTKGRLAEGVVFHTTDGSVVPELGRSSFKVINNKYLLKG